MTPSDADLTYVRDDWGDDTRESPAPSVGSTVLRIPRALFDKMHGDLARPHPFALERIGFMSVRASETTGGVRIVVAAEYQAIPDEEYVESPEVGARIGGEAIRRMLTHALVNQCGIFHVHAHPHAGIPVFSRTDRREQPRLIESLRAIEPSQPHGMLVLSDDAFNAWIWDVGTPTPTVPSRAAIVGYPLSLFLGSQLRGQAPTPASSSQSQSTADEATDATPDEMTLRDVTTRYARQSFLGVDSDQKLSAVRVGLIGYGGGGSHIGQQLAHIGFMHVRVADGDVIEETNLNRLVGATEHDVNVASAKVEIARRVLESVNSAVDLVTHRGRWQDAVHLFRDCDLLIGCIDTFAGRRELEVFSRRHAIAYIDIGMDVHRIQGAAPRMAGQVILSLPHQPCMWCFGFLSAERIALEAAKYGADESRPQVVWPNGILASSAIGIAVDLVTGWTGRSNVRAYLSYDGNLGTLTPHARLPYVENAACTHYSHMEVGAPVFVPLSSSS